MDEIENKNKQTDTININKKGKSKFFKVILVLLVLIAVILFINYFVNKSQEGKFFSVKNEAHLNKIINRDDSTSKFFKENFLSLFSFPKPGLFYYYNTIDRRASNVGGWDDIAPPISSSEDFTKTESNIDYSKTNVQIENIDEADVIKTDGEYVYSISDNKVLITEVIDKEKPKIMSQIKSTTSTYPMDILINNDKLIIISIFASSNSWDSQYRNPRSIITVYDISNKETPIKVKELEINSTYNTSRMIDNQVYIFASNRIYSNRNIKDFREYKEDYKEKEIAFKNIKYIKKEPIKEVTTFISLDLNSISTDANISSYFVDLENAYISFDNVYLLKTDYNYSSYGDTWAYIKKLFGFKGVIGFFLDDDIEDNSWGSSTKITKYTFSEDKSNIEFVENAKIKGKILNQYSCDEKDGYLRIALNDYKGTRIKVLDSRLREVGDTGPAAKGEDNKSVRFIGDRAYFVTYKNVDPLFAIDLSNPYDPRIMGELIIPGFSNYLHPYDDNHIIGIGMATNEEIIRDVYGRPIRENITFNGMKMTLFDISNIKNPIEKDVAYFGDSRTDSPINKNPKALLFSKEKNLIAIPVTEMGSIIPLNFDDLTEDSRNYQHISKQLVINEKVGNGYIVFNITQEGFKYKGIITHDIDDFYTPYDFSNIYNKNAVKVNQIRGLYINDYLLTVSSSLLKINKLENLEFVSNLELRKQILSKEEHGKTYVFDIFEQAE